MVLFLLRSPVRVWVVRTKVPSDVNVVGVLMLETAQMRSIRLGCNDGGTLIWLLPGTFVGDTGTITAVHVFFERFKWVLADRPTALPVFIGILLNLSRLLNGCRLHDDTLLWLLVDLWTGILVRFVVAAEDRRLQDRLIGIERRHHIVPRRLTLHYSRLHDLGLRPHDLLVPPMSDHLARLQVVRRDLYHLFPLVSLNLVIIGPAPHLSHLLEGPLWCSHMRSSP